MVLPLESVSVPATSLMCCNVQGSLVIVSPSPVIITGLLVMAYWKKNSEKLSLSAGCRST